MTEKNEKLNIDLTVNRNHVRYALDKTIEELPDSYISEADLEKLKEEITDQLHDEYFDMLEECIVHSLKDMVELIQKKERISGLKEEVKKLENEIETDIKNM